LARSDAIKTAWKAREAARKGGQYQQQRPPPQQQPQHQQQNQEQRPAASVGPVTSGVGRNGGAGNGNEKYQSYGGGSNGMPVMAGLKR
jgi:hypothetical protein